MKGLKDCDSGITQRIIKCAIEVHRNLGPGLLESVYEKALCIEIALEGISVEQQVECQVQYKGQELGLAFRADLIVEKRLLLEIKSVLNIADVHIAQTITYLRLFKIKRGLILNFNKPRLVDGIRRIAI